VFTVADHCDVPINLLVIDVYFIESLRNPSFKGNVQAKAKQFLLIYAKFHITDDCVVVVVVDDDDDDDDDDDVAI